MMVIKIGLGLSKAECKYCRYEFSQVNLFYLCLLNVTKFICLVVVIVFHSVTFLKINSNICCLEAYDCKYNK